ncbi:unnamed protein product [Amoebophrya sp. A25]|nr:unnamed protein product [Amoebophrya sp. A25]|eukprot:GSA25T00000017001.1
MNMKADIYVLEIFDLLPMNRDHEYHGMLVYSPIFLSYSEVLDILVERARSWMRMSGFTSRGRAVMCRARTLKNAIVPVIHLYITRESISSSYGRPKYSRLKGKKNIDM